MSCQSNHYDHAVNLMDLAEDLPFQINLVILWERHSNSNALWVHMGASVCICTFSFPKRFLASNNANKRKSLGALTALHALLLSYSRETLRILPMA